MFAKLLKHEWMGCRQILGILCAITLGSGLLMGLSGAYLTWIDGRRSYILAILLVFLSALAIGICAAGGFGYLLWRFYQSRFTDEGYLTFTLPAGNHAQLLAAIVNIFRGCALIFLATLGAGLLIAAVFTIGFMPRDMNWGEFFQAAAHYLPELLATIPWQGCLFLLAALLSGVIIPMLCITTGAVLTRKHQLLTAAAVWFGIGLVKNWGLFAIGFSGAFSNRLFFNYEVGSNLLIAVLGYLLMHWLTDKKLNLT